MLLMHAAEHGRSDAIMTVLRLNPKLKHYTDLQGLSPLHYSVSNGHIDCVRLLLRCGIPSDVVAKTGQHLGKTALQLASLSKHESSIRSAFSAEMLQSVVMVRNLIISLLNHLS